MADSSCCHGVQVGGVKGRGVPYFVNGPLASLDPPPPCPPPHLPSFSHTQLPPTPRFRTAGCFCGEGMGTQEPGSKRVTFQHLALAAPLLLLSLRLDPPFLYSTPALLHSLAFSPTPPHIPILAHIPPSLAYSALSSCLFFSTSTLF